MAADLLTLALIALPCGCVGYLLIKTLRTKP